VSNQAREAEETLQIIMNVANRLLPKGAGSALVVYNTRGELLAVTHHIPGADLHASRVVCVAALLNAAEAIATEDQNIEAAAPKAEA
jgi:hypothetical protein